MKKKIIASLCCILCLVLLSSCGTSSSDSCSSSASVSKNNYTYNTDGTNSNNTEEYKTIDENVITDALKTPLSTFSIDVDTASYSNVRRYINEQKSLPPKDAVRTEELINYFNYNYSAPKDNEPFSVTTEAASCPWNAKRNLVMIGVQGKKVDIAKAPSSNLVFLLDVSGSMEDENKLPLVKSAMKLLVGNLRENDKVSIVVYAGNSGVVLNPTSGSDKNKIIKAIDGLSAGGCTAGGEGIKLAYKLAKENFINGGNNRVILATDGDFNVGVSSESGLESLIEEKRKDNIFLSVLGFGTGNIKDNKMETLADKGNGNYSYIDNLNEAKKVLVEQMSGTLLTIAKDVKIQVEFNPSKVKAYRLIGYENRVMNSKDFNDDNKDAGELGAGCSVTAFYEIIPRDSDEKIDGVDDLKYQQTKVTDSDDLLTVKLRYKEPEGSESKLLSYVVNSKDITDKPSDNFRFASSVAEFGLLIRNSEYKGNSSYDQIIENAESSLGNDSSGYRKEFVNLVKQAQKLNNKN